MKQGVKIKAIEGWVQLFDKHSLFKDGKLIAKMRIKPNLVKLT